MTFTHIADAAEDDNWNEEELEEAWEEEDIFEPEDDDGELWMEENGDGT